MTPEERIKAEECMIQLQNILDITGASGSGNHNHIQELKIIDRKGCKNMMGQPIRDGLFVRPIWSDNPERNDGYYDICIEGDSPWGAVCDVMKWLDKKI